MLMITTKRGDRGQTDYFDKRVSKDSDLIETVGALDELHAVCGLVKLEKIQIDLNLIMGFLEEETRNKILETRIEEMEKEIGKMEKEISVPKKFLIFKKTKAVELNWVRTIVRRAERIVVKLETRNKKQDKNILIYLNRLSDYIYLLALKEENKIK